MRQRKINCICLFIIIFVNFHIPQVYCDSWTDYKNNPYSVNALEKYFKTCEENPTVEFSSWYISDVFNAKRKDNNSLLVTQIYDGTPDVGFKPGCLVIFDVNGKILNIIMRERVDVILLLPDFDFNRDHSLITEKRDNQQLIDLPDLNGDGYAEIPTQNWDDPRPRSFKFRTNSIYSTESNNILKVFTIEYHDNFDYVSGEQSKWPLNDIDFGRLSLKHLSKIPFSLVVSCRPYIQLSNESGQPISNWQRDDSVPPVILDKYTWNPQQMSFIGPKMGPKNLWVIK